MTNTTVSASPELPRSVPEEQGLSSSAIVAFLDAVADDPGELHSLIIVRHGHVVAEGYWPPYDAERQHLLYSLSKSFTSTAAGLAIAEGKLRLDDTVLSYFPDDAPADVSPNLAAMQVRHLLMMGTGHAAEPIVYTAADGNWERAFLAAPVEHEPGTHFLYNTAATYMVSAIVQKATGHDIVEYLTPRLFAPLGIRPPKTERSPRGVPFGGSGLYLTANDIAKFGQLYLQKGVWNGTSLIPAEWVETATAKQIANGDSPNDDWQQGYGFQFWRCRHGAYRGDGAFGQYCVVMPDQDAVVAIQSYVQDMGHILRLIWTHLLPAMRPEALPADAAEAEALRRRLSALAIRPPSGAATSPTAARVTGRTYRLPENDLRIETVRLEFAGADGGAVMIAGSDTGEDRIPIGIGEWRQGGAVFPTRLLSRGLPFPSLATAAQGAWTGDHTFAVKLCLVDTPFCPTLLFDFDGDRMTITVKGHIGFGPAERGPIVCG